MTRKERFDKQFRPIGTEGVMLARAENTIADAYWRWIEKEIEEAEIEARIDENHHWLKKEDIAKSSLAHIFVSRINELEK